MAYSKDIVHRIKDKYERYENHISSLALVVGFILDSLTLRRVDLLAENIVIFVYLLIAGGCIFLMNAVEKGDVDVSAPKKFHFWLLVLTQFAFGGLMSAFLVFYSRSSSIISSWPFLALIVFVFIGNEIFKKKYFELSFQIGILFFSLLSYLIFAVPTFFRSISVFSFLLGGILAVIVLGLFLHAMMFVAKEKIRKSRTILISSVISILLLVNLLYFLNFIPPLPLILKDSGVYHKISQNLERDFILVSEKKPWYSFVMPYDIYHAKKGERVFVSSSVYSPNGLNIDVYHVWQYFDESKHRWIDSTKVEVPITGGREEGYRLYSFKNSPQFGLWRVNVETEGGQIIGTIRFKIEETNLKPELITEIK